MRREGDPQREETGGREAKGKHVREEGRLSLLPEREGEIGVQIKLFNI